MSRVYKSFCQRKDGKLAFIRKSHKCNVSVGNIIFISALLQSLNITSQALPYVLTEDNFTKAKDILTKISDQELRKEIVSVSQTIYENYSEKIIDQIMLYIKNDFIPLFVYENAKGIAEETVKLNSSD